MNPRADAFLPESLQSSIQKRPDTALGLPSSATSGLAARGPGRSVRDYSRFRVLYPPDSLLHRPDGNLLTFGATSTCILKGRLTTTRKAERCERPRRGRTPQGEVSNSMFSTSPFSLPRRGRRSRCPGRHRRITRGSATGLVWPGVADRGANTFRVLQTADRFHQRINRKRLQYSQWRERCLPQPLSCGLFSFLALS